MGRERDLENDPPQLSSVRTCFRPGQNLHVLRSVMPVSSIKQHPAVLLIGLFRLMQLAKTRSCRMKQHVCTRQRGHETARVCAPATILRPLSLPALQCPAVSKHGHRKSNSFIFKDKATVLCRRPLAPDLQAECKADSRLCCLYKLAVLTGRQGAYAA